MGGGGDRGAEGERVGLAALLSLHSPKHHTGNHSVLFAKLWRSIRQEFNFLDKMITFRTLNEVSCVSVSWKNIPEVMRFIHLKTAVLPTFLVAKRTILYGETQASKNTS